MSFIYIADDKFFKLDDNLELEAELKTSKDDIITASLTLKDTITYTFKLPLSTPKEEVEANAEIQFFENAGIDLNKQYITHFIIKELKEEESYLIEAIAVDEDVLKSKFHHIIDKVKYIDFISFSILGFSEFYDLYEKEPKRDAFVYLDDKESFIAIYENGEYLYSKTLNSLNPLLKSLAISYSEFLDLVSQKGVDKEKYSDEEFFTANEIDKFFSEYFMAINNRISYGKSVFYLENIDNIYFYTPFDIEGIDSLKTFWDLSGINFEKIEIENINFLDKLIAYYNKNHINDELNFSMFPRPPKFYKTKTFQLMIVVLLTFLIFGGDFGYRYYQNQQLEKNINKLKHQTKLKSLKLKKLQRINKVVLEKLDKYNKQIDLINNKTKFIKNILENSLKVINLPKTNEDLITISNLLEKNNLQTFLISKDENQTFNIGIYTDFNNKKAIADFMENLYIKHYKNIKTDKIYTINNSYYMSLIRFTK